MGVYVKVGDEFHGGYDPYRDRKGMSRPEKRGPFGAIRALQVKGPSKIWP